jgi:hypothetical protein
MTNTTPRIIPEEKISDLRFGQLLILALDRSGQLKQISVPSDVNDEKYGEGVAYRVTGTDLFYLENDKLEEILQDYLKA